MSLRAFLVPFALALSLGRSAASDEMTAKKELEKEGLAFDAKTFFGRVEGGDTKAIALFLAAGFDPATRDESGRTALWAAVERKNAGSVKALLAGGAKPDARNAPPMEFGQSIVAAAVDGGDVEIVRTLLDAGADAKAGNEYGMTPLHAAAQLGGVEMVRLLLEAGADPNSAPSGAHVLFLPVAEDRIEVVELLLKSGSRTGESTRHPSSTPRRASG